LPQRLDERASTAFAGGHVASALAASARACIYYRLAATFLSMRGETEVPFIEDSRRCFRAVLDLDEQIQSETVEIPYGDQTLPAYLVAAVGRSEPGPGVIVLGGIDAFAEEMYFKIGRALVRQGFTVLLPDGPGQGESRRRRIPARYDYEVAISALVTYLSERPEVDSRRIALIGSSMGGYFAARGAAFEHRLCATVIWVRTTASMQRVHQQFATGHHLCLNKRWPCSPSPTYRNSPPPWSTSILREWRNESRAPS